MTIGDVLPSCAVNLEGGYSSPPPHHHHHHHHLLLLLFSSSHQISSNFMESHQILNLDWNLHVSMGLKSLIQQSLTGTVAVTRLGVEDDRHQMSFSVPTAGR